MLAIFGPRVMLWPIFLIGILTHLATAKGSFAVIGTILFPLGATNGWITILGG